MSYSSIDPIIDAWAAKNGFIVQTQYQDSEVRSVSVAGPNGKKFQIWIDRPVKGVVGIHVWDYKKNRRDWSTPISETSQRLEDAVSAIKEWRSA